MEAGPAGDRRAQEVFGDLTEKNVGQLKLLNSVIFPVHYNEKFYRDLLQNTELTRLAFYQDVLVGAVCCRLEDTKTGPHGKSLYIMTLGVLAPYRSLGIGSRLLNYVLDLCATKGVDDVYLHVQVTNELGINFYKRFGFEVKEKIANYYKRIAPRDCFVLQKVFQNNTTTTKTEEATQSVSVSA
eukprot:TRINITY_DN5937_c1_g1_i1.p2 TRINITY_DN5937_c1_g1~~TRINITY_DN5937_c1_g1_i1.p2  ORF type:complete len:184 (+),score=25.55 TRINITY_DN5937_c1_g1_i1:186-737(+)